MFNCIYQVFAVSVANTVDINVLTTIAAPPGVQNNTYFVAQSYSELNDSTFVNAIVNRICLFHRTYLC